MPRIVLAVASLLAVLATAATPAFAAPAPSPCRYLLSSQRLLPFPNDAFTRADRTSPTRRRVAISRTCTPRNATGVRIATTDQNRLDGFSPGSQLILQPPGVSNALAFRRSGLAPITDIGASLRANAPVVILDALTGQRQAHWAELDFNARSARNRMLLVHPAKNLREGRRYIVIVRGLRTAAGRSVRLAPGMALAARFNPKVRSLLAFAQRRRVSLANLHIAWDFTVASRGAIQSRLLSIRNSAFGQLGDSNLADGQIQGNSPQFAVTAVQDFTPAENAQLLRRVTGTFTVPCYLTSPGCAPGGRFNLSRQGLPTQRPGNVQTANFVCVIPRKAATAPGRGSLYGHGLLGDAEEATKGTSIHLMAEEHNFTFCATDWSGMSTSDLGTTVAILKDLSKFPQLTDRLQQGILNFTYLGRLMRHPLGLTTNPAFRVGGRPVFDPAALYYDGNSQGGIIGGALTAVAPDFRRAVLGVPGMNFSLLLTRSSNWKTYRAIFDPAYRSEAERPLALSLVQMLWDRSESNGWASSMTSAPPPGTPSHNVLMHVARGDWQVAPAAADIQARTIGARTNAVPIDPRARQDRIPLYGIPRITAFPYAGSAIIYWEPGGGLARVPKQSLSNTPDHVGVDPHGDPRYTTAARAQKAAFLSNPGTLINVCGQTFCQAEKDPARP